MLQLRTVTGGEEEGLEHKAAGWGFILGTWEAKKTVGTGLQGGPRCAAAVDGHHLQAAPSWVPPSRPQLGSSSAPSLPLLSGQDHGQWAGPPPLSPGAGAGQGEAEKGEAEEVGRKSGA